MTDIQKYQDAADKAFEKFHNSSYRRIPSKSDIPHIVNIARSIMLHRDGILNGGGFVTAVCENNLELAVQRADSVCAESLQYFVYCKLHVRP